MGLTFIEAQARKKANEEWKEEIIRLSRRRRSFRAPLEGEVPGIPEELRMAPKDGLTLLPAGFRTRNDSPLLKREIRLDGIRSVLVVCFKKTD